MRGVRCTHYAPPEMGGDRIINNGEQCLPQSRSQYISKSKWHLYTVIVFLILNNHVNNTKLFMGFYVDLKCLQSH